MSIKCYPIDIEIKGDYTIEQEYSCTLNQTNIKKNNNKFYIMQVLNGNGKYYLYTRYGRVGETGIKKMSEMTKSEAIKKFTITFKSKTNNCWDNRKNFKEYEGKYYLLDLDYTLKPTEIKPTKCSLDDDVAYLIHIISDVNIFNNVLVQFEIDTKKMPLGKISEKQIETARNILTKLSLNLDDDEVVFNLSSKYYQYIPYACGRRTPPLIKNQDMICKLIEMLDELKNIAVAGSVVTNIGKSDVHQLDNIYSSLEVGISKMPTTNKMWEIINTYIMSTIGKTHNFKIELKQIYELDKNNSKFANDIDNHMLLWHGSRISNFCSILKRGLILNPENLGVVITGKMFGYGVYFANCITKSLQYCDGNSSNNLCALLLCQVALGKQLEKIEAASHLSPQDMIKNKTHSTWGKGCMTPSSYITVDNVKIPQGKMIEGNSKSVLWYDEFIVYNVSQIKLKYLVLIQI